VEVVVSVAVDDSELELDEVADVVVVVLDCVELDVLLVLDTVLVGQLSMEHVLVDVALEV
jgi:hypothetical protein